MTVVLFGADGQLGRDMCRVLQPAVDLRPFTIHDTDITDEAVVRQRVADAKPSLVINAAAYTDVEGAEDDREMAFRVNETAAAYVAAAARDHGAPVVYISTDFVFDGGKTTPYDPSDPVAPSGVYAESKAAGEEAVRRETPNHYIVRTAWLYGPGGNNFVEKILRAAASRPSLRVVDDEVGSPTHTLDLAKAVAALADTGAFGTYHAVNEGSCSRYEFAKAILRHAGLSTPVEPCKAAEYPSKAPRPAYSVMSNAKLKAACGYDMPPWEAALSHYITRRESTQ